MGITYLDTDGIEDAYSDFQDGIRELENCVSRMERATSTLMDSWVGKGRNQFETEYQLIGQQLKDISDELYDIYQALLDAHTAYIDADEQVNKQIDAGMSSSNAGGQTEVASSGGGGGGMGEGK